MYTFSEFYQDDEHEGDIPTHSQVHHANHLHNLPLPQLDKSLSFLLLYFWLIRVAGRCTSVSEKMGEKIGNRDPPTPSLFLGATS